MANMTFNSLVRDIQQYCERSDEDFINQIPRIINLAEQAIAAEIKTLWETSVVLTSIQPNQTTIEKPARWRKTLSMKTRTAGQQGTIGSPVLLRDQTFISQFTTESPQGQPQYYSDWDYNNWLIAPAPDQPYVLEISYQGRIQPLDVNNQVNLLTRECPQLILFGSMLQAVLYLKSFEKLQLWKPLYDQALSALKQEDRTRFIDSNSKREQE